MRKNERLFTLFFCVVICSTLVAESLEPNSPADEDHLMSDKELSISESPNRFLEDPNVVSWLLDNSVPIYGERVQRIVRFRMGHELRAKLESMDVVQDAFIAAVKGLDKFQYRDEGDFLRWIAKIAENRIRDNLKQLHADKRDIRREVPLDHRTTTSEAIDTRMPEPVRMTTPSVILSAREDLDKLENAMNLLKPEYREVIVLRQI